METSSAEAEGSSEDLTGKKKSKLKVLKTRLFGRMKRKETEGLMKQSQSASDVTAEEAEEGGGDSGDEFLYSHSMLGSRAMSHDSIFLADEAQAPAEPVRILSQENVPGKIKALQMKLQQQNLRLGPPPLLIPGKRGEDTGVNSEDDGLPHSPPETSLSLSEGLTGGTPKFPDTHRNLSSLSLAGTGSEEEEQGCPEPPSQPLSPPTKPAPPSAPAALPGVDFDSPAQYTPCLDSSAARHRMSIKPRNQRVSTKGRRLPSSASRPRSESLNALVCPLPERDEEEEGKDAVRIRSYSTQVIRSREGSRDPVMGQLHLCEEEFGVEHTDIESRNSDTSSRLSSVPDQLEGHATMNPLFLPRPLGLKAPWMQDLGTGESRQNSDEVQKPSETKQPAICQTQGGDSVKEGPNDPEPRDSLNKSLAPSTTPLPAPAENNMTKAPKKSVQGVAQEPVRPQATPRTQPLPSPLPATAALPPPAPRTWSLKRNTTKQTQQDCQHPEPPQSVTAPPAGTDDQRPPEGANNGKQQRPNSGSFRFSIASAWDRPRGGSLQGREDKRGATKTSSTSLETLVTKPEEARPRPMPLSPASGEKAEPAKASLISRREEQMAAASEEAKLRDQSRNMAPFQERTSSNAKGKESTAPRGPGRISGGGDLRMKQVAMETGKGVEEGKDSRETQSGGLEEESKGEKDERPAFGVKLRSTSQSLKYRQREASSVEPKSLSLSVEGCTLGQSHDHQSNPLGQSHDPQSSPISQSRDTQGGPHGQSRDTQGGPLGQSRDSQALIPTKRPEPLQQHNMVTQGSQPVKQENDLKAPLHRKRTSPNSDPPTSPADPRSTPPSSTKYDLSDRERPGAPKRGDDVDLATEPSLDAGPAPKPASAPPKEAEPVVLEPVASEPAWMTIAREKTRSLQQLITSRLPREFGMTTSVTTSTPKPTPQPAPQTPAPAPQPSPQVPPLATPPGRGDKAPQGTAERTATPQGSAGRGAQTEKKNNGKTPLMESTAAPADKRPERIDRSFSVGGKTEPKAALPETHSTAEAKMEGSVTCRVIASEAAPSSSAVQSREREDRQPIKPESSSAPPALSSGGQPSWMELAKRKSLAWSDKAMD